MSDQDSQAAKPSPEEDAASKRLAEDMEAFSQAISNRWDRRYSAMTATPFTEATTTWRKR